MNVSPMTDIQIYDLALKDWYSVLESLWVAIGKQPEKERVKIYAKAFSAVPLGLLEKAIQRVQLISTYNIVPTIAEVNKAIQVELHEANCTSYQGWCDQVWTIHPGSH